MLNQISLMGRLTRDVELRYTQSGTAVASFTIACERDYSGKDGGEKQTDFIDIVAWRGTAEFASKYFFKGQLCAVSGRLQLREWRDKDDNKRRSAEVVANSIYFAEGKRDRGGAPAAATGSEYRAAPPTTGEAPPYGGYSSAFTEIEDDGELPFEWQVAAPVTKAETFEQMHL